MNKEDVLEMEGTIAEALSNGMFRITLENGHEVLGHLAGRMRRFRIKVLLGDKVKVETISLEPKERKIALSMRSYQQRLESGALRSHRDEGGATLADLLGKKGE